MMERSEAPAIAALVACPRVGCGRHTSPQAAAAFHACFQQSFKSAVPSVQALSESC